MQREPFDTEREAGAYADPAFRQERRAVLYELLGDLPATRGHQVTVVEQRTEEHGDYVVERSTLDLNGVEPVPAVLLKPAKSPAIALPLVIYNHAHWDDYERGKEEAVVGRREMQMPPYGVALARAGYAVLSIDQWGFGGRRGKTETAIFKEMLWKGQVLWGAMVYDGLRLLDYAAGRSDIDHARVGVLGMSMGATMSWWMAALDERVKACIDLCCLTDFQSLIEENGLDLHGVYYYAPRLLQHFTTSHINALIAPRPHLSLAGNNDPLTPARGLDVIDGALKAVYRAAGAAPAWQLWRYDAGHRETPEMRLQVMRFLEQWL